MAAVFIQVGQCGLQVGQQFWRDLLSLETETSEKHSKKRNDSSVHSFVSLCKKDSHTLHLVLVDSERKVAQQLRKDARISSLVKEENVVTDKCGRGGNWAYGYHGGRSPSSSGSGPALLATALERHRREVESCDRFCGTILMHSLAGGTGSGLGSHLIESIRDELPVPYILSVVVAPHRSGDSPLQHYNSLLALAHIQEYSDGAIIFQNDAVLEDIAKLPKKEKKEKMISQSMMEINQYIGSCISNAFRPVSGTRSFIAHGSEPWELLKSTCPLPHLKLVTPSHSAGVTPSWDQLSSRLLQSASVNSVRYSNKAHSVSTTSVIRGSRANISTFEQRYMAGYRSKSEKCYNFVTWNPFPHDMWLSREQQFSENKTMSSFSNSSVVLPYLNTVVEKAGRKLAERAYVHWYKQYGCEEEDFGVAMETVNTIISNYHYYCQT